MFVLPASEEAILEVTVDWDKQRWSRNHEDLDAKFGARSH
jgi:hypothetical protein